MIILSLTYDCKLVNRHSLCCIIESRGIIFCMYQTSYNVTIPSFSGPLDLLLKLIERQELDITEISLALVTDQYIRKISGIDKNKVESIADFIVVAAKLVLIKSQSLLPKPPLVEEGEVDHGDDLVRQLLIYKKYKGASQWLDNRNRAGLRSFVRIGAPVIIDKKLDLEDVDLESLRQMMIYVLNKPKIIKKSVSEVVGRPRITVKDSIRNIAVSMRNKLRVSFFSVLSSNGRKNTRTEIIATFLGVLELTRRNMVKTEQTDLFGDIDIIRLGEWSETEIDGFSSELDQSGENTTKN